MTEEDTFNALRREPFFNVYSRWLGTYPTKVISEEDLKGTGWTLAEVRDVFKRWVEESVYEK